MHSLSSVGDLAPRDVVSRSIVLESERPRRRIYLSLGIWMRTRCTSGFR